MTRPRQTLHAYVLSRVAAIVGTLDLVRVPHVAFVGIDTLARLEIVRENTVKKHDVGPRTGGVRSLDPNQIPREDVHLKLET